jgi:hypothetical protein
MQTAELFSDSVTIQSIFGMILSSIMTGIVVIKFTQAKNKIIYDNLPLLKPAFLTPDPTFSILDPGSMVENIPDLGSGSASKKKFNTKISKIRSAIFILDPGSGFFFHPGSGSRIQGVTKHLVPDPDPQH